MGGVTDGSRSLRAASAWRRFPRLVVVTVAAVLVLPATYAGASQSAGQACSIQTWGKVAHGVECVWEGGDTYVWARVKQGSSASVENAAGAGDRCTKSQFGVRTGGRLTCVGVSRKRFVWVFRSSSAKGAATSTGASAQRGTDDKNLQKSDVVAKQPCTYMAAEGALHALGDDGQDVTPSGGINDDGKPTCTIAGAGSTVLGREAELTYLADNNFGGHKLRTLTHDCAPTTVAGHEACILGSAVAGLAPLLEADLTVQMSDYVLTFTLLSKSKTDQLPADADARLTAWAEQVIAEAPS